MIEMQTLWECRYYTRNGLGERSSSRHLVVADKAEQAYRIFKEWLAQREIPFQRISVTTTDEVVLVK